MDKDYTLLRPFNPVKARAGEAICTDDLESVQYVAGPDEYTNIVVKTGPYFILQQHRLRMRPLSWLECRPVYEGDEAYGKASGKKYVASKAGLYCDGSYYSLNEEEFAMLTWTKPSPKKIKRTVKYLAYEDPMYGNIGWVKESRGGLPNWSRLPEFDLSREIEEEVK